MKTDIELLNEAQDIFENMEFMSYTVEATDGWKFERYRGDGYLEVAAECSLTVYVLHEEMDYDEPTCLGFVNVRFDSNDNPVEAYCTDEDGNDIAVLDVKKYLIKKSALLLEEELKSDCLSDSVKSSRPKL